MSSDSGSSSVSSSGNRDNYSLSGSSGSVSSEGGVHMEVIPSSGSRENDSVRWSSSFVLGHMAKFGKKNLNLFRTLCKEQVEKSKNAGNTEVPNMQ
ncbi:hypothetical protein DEO72_LG6g1035 [Vigna unguiculata]|uniref:Uncharacterized protein n=1 Tax=Vigna unguiculata TaxID=3917 RepID=A0A4D6M6D6_VIGUN|nr:hypothetical protein DEO72_LG6g1035 [Vigna unguiculata]